MALNKEEELAKEAKEKQVEAGKTYGRGIEQEKVLEIFPKPIEKVSCLYLYPYEL